uniref:Uncharacterized protein n=1 Tax=Arundo donax TaxID=35708 RepID=A0A0A9GUR3_ARUDO
MQIFTIVHVALYRVVCQRSLYVILCEQRAVATTS